MRTWIALLLALTGVLIAVAGVALIYPPAALILFGSFCVAVSLFVEVRDT